MKNLFKIFLVLGLILVTSSAMYAIGTTNDFALTNIVTGDGFNFPTILKTNISTVTLIAGGNWVSTVTDVLGADAGGFYTNISYLTNLGNDTINYRIGVDAFVTNPAGGNNGEWSWDLLVGGVNYIMGDSGAAAEGADQAIDSGYSVQVMFIVEVDPGATSGWQEWRLYAIASPNDPPANPTNYQGDNGQQYGGPVGRGWSATRLNSLVFYDTGTSGGTGLDYAWSVGAAAPVIRIYKDITAISDVSGGGSLVIPGATLTYTITVSNTGPGSAQGLRIRDVIDTVILDDTGLAASMNITNIVNNGQTFTSDYTAPTVKWSNNNGFPGGSVTELSYQAVIR
jgi:hypothetical protein